MPCLGAMDLLRDNSSDAATLATTFHALLEELFVHSISTISSTVYKLHSIQHLLPGLNQTFFNLILVKIITSKIPISNPIRRIQPNRHTQIMHHSKIRQLNRFL